MSSASIGAILPTPRLGFTDHMMQYHKALAPFGVEIHLYHVVGVFWGQNITTLIERCVDKHPYILTMDYDTLFTAEDVQTLFTEMDDQPYVDAICALQMRRGMDAPFMDGCDPDDFVGAKTRVKHGNFGLCLFRSESFAKVEKPWFHSVPDPNGSWGEGRMDDDIAFWERWYKAGNTVYVHNRVAAGHMQLMVTFPDGKLMPRHQYLQEYLSNGKPDYVFKPRA